MRMSKTRWSPLAVAILCVSLPWVDISSAQEKSTDGADQTKQIRLQYRVKLDSLMPSSFLAADENGLSGPVKLIWDISKAEEPAKRQFEDLVKKLEEQSINGVEFECQGEWLKSDLNAAPSRFKISLRVTSVPKLTESGKKRFNDQR